MEDSMERVAKQCGKELGKWASERGAELREALVN